MSESISFTIPNDPRVLRAVADYLNDRAAGTLPGSLSHIGVAAQKPVTTADLQDFKDDVIRVLCAVDASAEAKLVLVPTKEDAAELLDRHLRSGKIEPLHSETAKPVEETTASAADAFTEEVAPGPETGELTSAAAVMFARSEKEVDISIVRGDSPGLNDEEIKDIVAGVSAPDVELADGMPWDHRIHASSKAKLSKAPHGWKKKRGVTGALVEQVEAELRAAMLASPAKPVTTEEAAPPPDTEEAAPPPVETTATTEPPVITTFAELNIAITEYGVPLDKVTAAVNRAGLQAYPLLAARSDLWPQVIAELFPAPAV